MAWAFPADEASFLDLMNLALAATRGLMGLEIRMGPEEVATSSSSSSSTVCSSAGGDRLGRDRRDFLLELFCTFAPLDKGFFSGEGFGWSGKEAWFLDFFFVGWSFSSSSRSLSRLAVLVD